MKQKFIEVFKTSYPLPFNPSLKRKSGVITEIECGRYFVNIIFGQKLDNKKHYGSFILSKQVTTQHLTAIKYGDATLVAPET